MYLIIHNSCNKHIHRPKRNKKTTNNNTINIKYNNLYLWSINSIKFNILIGGKKIMQTTNIRISADIAEKLKEIKEANQLKSINQTLEHLIPQAVNEDFTFIKEPTAFTIANENISFTDLKENKTGKTWSNEQEQATIIFKDDLGVVVRFTDKTDKYTTCEYFHFL